MAWVMEETREWSVPNSPSIQCLQQKLALQRSGQLLWAEQDWARSFEGGRARQAHSGWADTSQALSLAHCNLGMTSLVPSIQQKLSPSPPAPAQQTPYGCEIERDVNVPWLFSQNKWAVKLFNSAKSFSCLTRSHLSVQPQADTASLPGPLEQPLFLHQIPGGRTAVSSHQSKRTNCWKNAGEVGRSKRKEQKWTFKQH